MGNETSRRRLDRVASKVTTTTREHDPDIDRRIAQLIAELEHSHPGEAARIIAEMSPDVPA